MKITVIISADNGDNAGFTLTLTDVELPNANVIEVEQAFLQGLWELISYKKPPVNTINYNDVIIKEY